MLLSFRVANHRSIHDEQQLNLAAMEEGDPSAVPVAGIFGANAAGKSNAIDALRFMRYMVTSSHRDAEPDGGIKRFPFALDPVAVDDPSWYVVDLNLHGVRHTYGFSIDSTQVLEEWLFTYVDGEKSEVFCRSEEVNIRWSCGRTC